jgi:hypothetical protein
MGQHILSLEAPDTMNDCILRVVDTTVYDPILQVDCPRLEVTLPGFSYSVQLGEDKIAPGFILNLTACDLEVQKSNCGKSFDSLPDGVYIIKYSVSPNDQVYVEYNHLRITSALNTYKNVMCDIDVAGCEPNSETAKKLEQLRKIKSYLEAAKAKVEICHEPKKGMEIYNYATKLLSKFECNSCQ